MKVVVTGKGGAGKTTVSGTMARLLARRGQSVVAVDCDPSPNLGVTLGLSIDAVESMDAVLNGLIRSGHTHNDPRPDPEMLLERYGVDTPDGVRLVATGKIERIPNACVCCGSHATTRELFSALSDDGRTVIADLEAGLNDLIWAKPGSTDVVIAVAEPSAKAFEVARRARDIADTLGVKRIIGVAARCHSEAERVRLSELLGVETIAIPDDPSVQRADHLGISPLDHDAGSPAMVAIDELTTRLLDG